MNKFNTEFQKVYKELSAIFADEITIIAVALALFDIQRTGIIDVFTFKTFIDCASLPESVKEVLSRYIGNTEEWEKVKSLIGKYPVKVLKAIVLLQSNSKPRNRFENFAVTSQSIVQLSAEILDIQPKDTVMDLCSGAGNFLSYVDGKYKTGVEINQTALDIAKLKSALSKGKFRYILDDAITHEFEEKYDKCFSNYPLVLNGNELEEYRRIIGDELNIDIQILERVSSCWLFNAKLFNLINENGKAVAIMPNGGAFNTSDKLIREYFTKYGYIQAVISLPPNLMTGTAIPVTLIIFSRGNDKIRLIDATEIFTKEKRTNILSDENIQEIVNLLKCESDEKVIDLNADELAEKEYSLVASRYITKEEISNGVSFETVMKNITRGCQLKASELDFFSTVKGTNVRLVSVANVNNGIICFDSDSLYLKEISAKLEKYVIPDKALILSKIATPTFRSAIAEVSEEEMLVANGNLFIIEIDDTKANPYYIQALFESQLGADILNGAYRGVTLKTLSIEELKKMIIPLPPMSEQNRIAEKYQSMTREYVSMKKKITDLLKQRRELI